MFTPDNIITRRKKTKTLAGNMADIAQHFLNNISCPVSRIWGAGVYFYWIEPCEKQKSNTFPNSSETKKGNTNWLMRKESSVNTPLVVRKILNHVKCCRIFEILTPEQRIVWRASGSAWRAPPTLAEVWSLEERVFLEVHITVSHCTHATWRQCWQTHRSCI